MSLLATEAYLKKNGGLHPWSVTKMDAIHCKHLVESFFSKGLGENFKSTEDEDEEDKSSLFLLEGIALHEAIEQHILHQTGKREQPPHLGTILNRLGIPVDSWLECFEQFKMAQDFFAFDAGTRAPLFYGGDVELVEKRVGVNRSWEPTKEGELPFCKGTIDLLQRQGEVFTITDHKRQWNVMSETAMAQRFQFQLYASLIFAHFPRAQKVVLRIYYIRFGTTKETTFFREDVRFVPEMVRNFAEAAQHNLFQDDYPSHSPGPYCALCPIASGCEGLAMMGPPKDPIFREDAEKIAANLSLLKRITSDLTAALKKYAALHGPIETGSGKSLGFVPAKDPLWSSSNEEGLLAFVGALGALGVLKDIKFNPADLISINGKALKKLAAALKDHCVRKGDPGLYDEFTSLAGPETKTTFREHVS